MTGTFAENAEKLRAAGWAVMPSRGKTPLRSGFPKWTHPPSKKAVEQWAEKLPDADIVFVNGMNRTEDDCETVMLDCDDMEMVEFVERKFGKTPGRTRTRQGEHHYFKMPAGTDLGKLHGLRHVGLNIDVKHGQRQAAISAAPPSVHEKDPSRVYEWIDCDETVIKHLPTLDIATLFDIADGPIASKRRDPEDHILLDRAPGVSRSAMLSYASMRDGSRRQWLNDRLCRDVPWCESFDDLLDCARSHNASLVRGPKGMLPDEVVVERAKAVWKVRHRFVPMDNRRATALTDADEIRAFAALGQAGQDAHTLVQIFRAEHGARVAEGSTFQVRCEAMARAKVIGNWSAERYRRALKVLLTVGSVVEARPSAFRRAAEYTLGARIESPSIARRGAV